MDGSKEAEADACGLLTHLDQFVVLSPSYAEEVRCAAHVEWYRSMRIAGIPTPDCSIGGRPSGVVRRMSWDESPTTLESLRDLMPFLRCLEVSPGHLGTLSEPEYTLARGRNAHMTDTLLPYADRRAAIERMYACAARVLNDEFIAEHVGNLNLRPLPIHLLPSCGLDKYACLQILRLGDVFSAADSATLVSLLPNLPNLHHLTVGRVDDAGVFFAAPGPRLRTFSAATITRITAPSHTLVRIQLRGDDNAPVTHGEGTAAGGDVARALLAFPCLTKISFAGTGQYGSLERGTALTEDAFMALVAKATVMDLSAQLVAAGHTPEARAASVRRVMQACVSAAMLKAARSGTLMHICIESHNVNRHARGRWLEWFPDPDPDSDSDTPPRLRITRFFTRPLAAYLIYHRTLVLAGRARPSLGRSSSSGTARERDIVAWLCESAPLWVVVRVCEMFDDDVYSKWDSVYC
jgi:hypothetical protein